MTTKIALVTGAACGIGCTIALCLAKDGLDVAVNDLPNTPELDDVVQEIENKGWCSLTIPADISLISPPQHHPHPLEVLDAPSRYI